MIVVGVLALLSLMFYASSPKFFKYLFNPDSITAELDYAESVLSGNGGYEYETAEVDLNVAEPHFENVLRKKPDSIRALLGLAWIREQRHDFVKAEECYQRTYESIHRTRTRRMG